MNVELVKNNGETIGWKLIAENEEDRLRLGSIRNMQFWGFDDTAISYQGVTTWEQDDRYAQTLEWRQKKFIGVKLTNP